MKNLVVFLFVAFISISTFANNTNPKESIKSTIRTEIVKLLGKVNFQLEETIETTVEFLINRKGQIIVLTVNSSNKMVDSFVKNRLNYKVVASSNTFIGKTYRMPLKLKK